MENNQPLILVGGGEHCVACMDVIQSQTGSIGGVLDLKTDVAIIGGYPVLGTDANTSNYIGTHFFLITIGQLGVDKIRNRRFAHIKQEGGRFATVVSSLAYKSQSATIGEGSIVMHHALVNVNATIGANCIINSKALIEHDCAVGNHCHVSTAAVLNGGCVVGDRSFIGSGSVLVHGVSICEDVLIGAGSLVLKSINEPGVYAGSPVKKIK